MDGRCAGQNATSVAVRKGCTASVASVNMSGAPYVKTTYPRRRGPYYAAKGFTLIELLIAISILSIVAVLGWRGLDSLVRSRVALDVELEESRAMQLTFAQLQNDCRQLASSRVLGKLSPLYVQNNRLVIARTVSRDNQPLQLAIVDYRVRDGILRRWESSATRDLSAFNELWQSVVSGINVDAHAAQAVVLQTHVTSIQTRLWNNSGAYWQTVDSSNIDTLSLADNRLRWNGLEVSLQLKRSSQHASENVIKAFFLGDA